MGVVDLDLAEIKFILFRTIGCLFLLFGGNFLFGLADRDALLEQGCENVIQLLNIIFGFGHNMQHFIVADKALFAAEFEQMGEGFLRTGKPHVGLHCALFEQGRIRIAIALLSLFLCQKHFSSHRHLFL